MNYMQRALQLAEQGRYTCAPNPMVGCVIVCDNKIVGEGFHRKAGEAHAEIIALQQAGEQAQGATVYVTLEPCTHTGRTGPCVEALIKAKVAEVIIATIDANPKVAGKSIDKLRAAGILVRVGELAQQARELNKIFFHYITTRLPFVIAKWAISLDGKIATYNQDSKWITSEAARQHVHELRQQIGAIIIGSGTVLSDDPLLTVRLAQPLSQPIRVVLDARGRSPINAKIFSEQSTAKTMVFTTKNSSDTWRKKLQNKAIEIIVAPLVDQKIDLNFLLKELAQREISSVLVEGGSQVHASFFKYNLVQQIYSYIAPKIIGGKDAPSAMAGSGIEHMIDAKQWQFTAIKSLPPDVLLIAEKQNV